MTIADRMKCALSLGGGKISWFYRKILH